MRLAGMAALLERLRPSLTESLAQTVLGADNPREAIRVLTVRGADGSPIGEGRATEMLASAVLPLLAACFPDDRRPEQLYASLPAPPANRWTRKMTALLGEAGHGLRPLRAPEHQGLHWLYHVHCRYERRAGCPVCSLPRSASGHAMS
jgi:hypothetical protein